MDWQRLGPRSQPDVVFARSTTALALWRLYAGDVDRILGGATRLSAVVLNTPRDWTGCLPERGLTFDLSPGEYP